MAHSSKSPTKRAGAHPGQRQSGPARRRAVSTEVRRQSILDAALKVFAKHGFAAARLDDVAAAAGVAKGTLYLYFIDKEALFEDLVRSTVAPVLAEISAKAEADVPLRVFLPRLFEVFRTEVLGTDRKLILRLVLTEGQYFPSIAEFYHREIVSRGIKMLRKVARRAAERGELASDAVARFPQLIMAPLLVAVLWDGLFARFDPLDVEGLLGAHAEVLLGRRGRQQ